MAENHNLAFITIAENLGASFTTKTVTSNWGEQAYISEFTLVVDGVPVVATANLGRGGLLGVNFMVRLLRPISTTPIEFRHETRTDRVAKSIGINREFQAMVPSFDRSVYIDTREPDSTLQPMLVDPVVRTCIASIVRSTAVLAIGAPDSHSMSCRFSVKRARKSAVVLTALQSFVRLSAQLNAHGVVQGQAYRDALEVPVVLAPGKKSFNRVVVLAICVLPVISWLLCLIVPNVIIGGYRDIGPMFNHVGTIGALGGALVWLVVSALAVSKMRGRSNSLNDILLVSGFSLTLIFDGRALARWFNQAADAAPCAWTDATYVARSVKRSTYLDFTVSSPSGEVTIDNRDQSAIDGQQDRVGSAQVCVAPGALHSPWLVSVRR